MNYRPVIYGQKLSWEISNNRIGNKQHFQYSRKLKHNRIFVYLIDQHYHIIKDETNIRNLLVLIAEKDDEIAFKHLFDLFVHGLTRFAFIILKNKELADEVVSDLFFKIWTQRKKNVGIENFKAYLFTSIRNISLNYLTKKEREKVFLLEDISVALPIDEINPESELISKELRDAISIAINHLPERCKLIYSLAKIEQLKYKEIAEILNISVKTIDHQLTIAIKKIGEEIHNYLEEKGSKEKYTTLLYLFTTKKR